MSFLRTVILLAGIPPGVQTQRACPKLRDQAVLLSFVDKSFV